MGKLIDLTDKKFGRLTVLYRDTHKNGAGYWVCKCSCGNIISVYGYNLRIGKTKSCGCYHKDIIKTHNKRNSIEYSSWDAMKTRCYNTSYKGYKNYGGRGIKVCDRWLNSFENFYEDMGNRPSTGYTIERIDNNKDYELSNCRWATYKEQAQNKRNNINFKYNGKEKCISEWAIEFGIDPYKVYKRLASGWTEEESLEIIERKKKYSGKIPKDKIALLIKLKSDGLSYLECSKKLNIEYSQVWRIYNQYLKYPDYYK